MCRRKYPQSVPFPIWTYADGGAAILELPHLDHVPSEVAVVGEGKDHRAEHGLILRASCITSVHMLLVRASYIAREAEK